MIVDDSLTSYTREIEASLYYTNNWLATLSNFPSLIPSSEESTLTSPAYSEFNLSPFSTLSTLSEDNNQDHQNLQNDHSFFETYKIEDLNLNLVQENESLPQSLNDLAEMILYDHHKEVGKIQQDNLLGLCDTKATMSQANLSSERMYTDLNSLRQSWNPFLEQVYPMNNLISNEYIQRQYYPNLSSQGSFVEPTKRVEKRRQSNEFEDMMKYLSNVYPESTSEGQVSSINNRQRRSGSFITSTNQTCTGSQKQRLIKRHRSHTDASMLFTRQSIGNLDFSPPLPAGQCSSDHFKMIGQAAINAIKRERSDSFASSTLTDQQDNKSTVRDEQNRQKSKRYYERKKAQNFATTALCTALDAWQAIFSTSSQTIELPEIISGEEVTAETIQTSSSQRKKLYKIAQRNEETRQIRTIMSSAKRLESLLKSTPSSEITKIIVLHRQFSNRRDKSTIEMFDHLSNLEAGLCIWLDHIHSWSDLVLAEKRLADIHTGKPVQGLISLLSNIS